MVCPGHQLPGRVDASLQVMEAGRPVQVMTRVVFARPQQLHRLRDLHGDRRRLDHVVVAEPAPESTPHPRQVDRDVLFGDA